MWTLNPGGCAADPIPASDDPRRRANPTQIRASEVPDARGRHGQSG